MDFLFKDRGSGKRTIKPSKDSESLEACMAAEESDDSDFEVRKMHKCNNIVGEKDNSGEMMRMILTTEVSLWLIIIIDEEMAGIVELFCCKVFFNKIFLPGG